MIAIVLIVEQEGVNEMGPIDKQALKEKLARWRGFKKFGWKNWELWLKPDEKPPEKLSISGLFPNSYALPNFPEDETACFKWLVPKLLDEYNIESYSFKQGDNWYYSETNIWRKGNTKHSFEVLQDEHIAKHFEQGASLSEITALALCLAIEKLIDEETK